MNDSTASQQTKETQQVAQLVLEEIISQRNTLMNEIASLNVQLKVVQKKCELLEKELKKTGASEVSGEGD